MDLIKLKDNSHGGGQDDLARNWAHTSSWCGCGFAPLLSFTWQDPSLYSAIRTDFRTVRRVPMFIERKGAEKLPSAI